MDNLLKIRLLKQLLNDIIEDRDQMLQSLVNIDPIHFIANVDIIKTKTYIIQALQEVISEIES